MDRCMATLLPGGDEVEILIVDDGSTDRTAEIADEYERKYPNIVRAIHKENGGHGDAVTTGIRNATGLFFISRCLIFCAVLSKKIMSLIC